MTSNQFLSTAGNPTRIEAEIGRHFLTDGLEAAFRHIDERLAPHFLKQRRNTESRGNNSR
jgi:hypothetical protein